MSVDEVIWWLNSPVGSGASQALALPEHEQLHGLLMAIAAGVLLPLAVLVARYFKILPGQDWPRELNRRFWWFSHLTLAYGACIALVAGYLLIVGSFEYDDQHLLHPHAWIGWLSAAMVIAMFLNGWQRGSAGGPGKPAPGTRGPLHGVAGDHYDMTAHRRWFESSHKLLGYSLLLVLIAAVVSGLSHANAPRWTLVALAGWWVLLLLLALRWEHQGRCVDGYQAVWGPGMDHPGNRIPTIGWGSRRHSEEEFRRLSWTRKRP